MAALTGNSVGSSYLGLIKTTDNAALDLADRAITDGAGNVTPLNLSTQAVKVEGAGKAFEINDANFQVNTDNTVIASADGVSQGFAVTGTATTFGGNVDFSGATVTGLPSGGGTPAPFVSYASGKYDGSAQGPYTFFTDRLAFYPVHLTAGQELTKLDFEITTAFTTASISFAVFTTQNTTNANGDAFVPHDNVASLGSVSGSKYCV